MLEYHWGNPSTTIMITGDETTQDLNTTRPVFDPYVTQNFSEPTNFVNSLETHFATYQYPNLQFHSPNFNTHLSNFYTHAPSGSGLGPTDTNGFMVPKTEAMVSGLEYNTDLTSRIGLNLGGRTYFSSTDDDFVSRLYRRSSILEPGLVNTPRCQVEGCDADLSQAKHYHRRHKVCEFHSKSATVIAAGLTQRFCQQCSRFHLLSEFDNGKRSCRRRLADHNRRRRKSSLSNQENANKGKLEKDAPDSSSENPDRSPAADSGNRSFSSVTIAISPPQISLDYFGRRSNYAIGTTTSSTASTSSSLFYSNS